MRVATPSKNADQGQPDPPTSASVSPGDEPSSQLDLAQAAEVARAWVTEHPLAALGLAVATGFLVGRLVRR
jgi:hypothetical protein